MRKQHCELQAELITDLAGYAHIAPTSRTAGSNTLILCEPLRTRAWLAVRRWIVIPDHVRVVGNRTRGAIISDRRITGLSAGVIAEFVAEVGPLWHERHRARLESRPRRRAVGAGAKHHLLFIDRLLATLVHLRHGATHDVPACWFGVDRSTITRAIGEVQPCPQHAPAPSWPASASAPLPRSSTTSAPAGRPGSSTGPRFGP
ncbi:transposase family protein [Streptomyces sp. Isolate_45]|uniref:helix-turn-helix domain-containing protein n=1 Tax=Streptomyces sp. Isolate_45 TaxID=2950111 RepID=UPI002481C889|nr:transposase family protein [Streptomyces sp. Isolate_45]MDA5282025.1 transposase family protein [Streptomyces sp. Isolate_45]